MFRKILLILCLLLISRWGNASSGIVNFLCLNMQVTDCDLVRAVIDVESRGRNVTVEDNGSLSYGPMQIKCGTARLMGFKKSCDKLMIAHNSLYYGIKYLEYQIKRYGNFEEAVAAYNSGTLIRCKHYNPGKCHPGEIYNQAHVKKVHRSYLWLKSKSPKTLVHSWSVSNSWGGSESSTTVYKKASPTSLVYIEENSSESK